MHVDMKYVESGMHFTNNWDNIDDVRRMTKIQSFILNKIKNNPDIILTKDMSMCKDMYFYKTSLTKQDLI